MKLSWRRIVAEMLALIDYRRFKAIYWRLRAPDIQTRYAFRDDYPTLRSIIERYGVKSVCDVGCGEGRLFPLYKDTGVERLFAIEMSEHLHEIARRRAAAGEAPAQAEIALGDVTAAALVLPPSDLVVAARALQHIPPQDVAALSAKIAAAAGKAIYVNETLLDKPRAAYTFLHDYDTLFGAHGFAVAANGRIPNIDYEYRLYERRK